MAVYVEFSSVYMHKKTVSYLDDYTTEYKNKHINVDEFAFKTLSQHNCVGRMNDQGCPFICVKRHIEALAWSVPMKI
jgi:hypothetical protein